MALKYIGALRMMQIRIFLNEYLDKKILKSNGCRYFTLRVLKAMGYVLTD